MNFDKRTEILLSHIVQNNAKEAIAILKSGDFSRRILEDIGGFEAPLPLYKITVLNSIILSDKKWNEWFIPVVEDNRKEIKIIKDFFEEEYKYSMNDSFNFSDYKECAHYHDWDIEDLLEGSLDQLEAKGYNRNEAELCYATLTYDIPILEKHIALQTNPDVYISYNFSPNDDSSDMKINSYNAYDFCYDVVEDAFSCYCLGAFYKKKEPIPVRKTDINTILQCAAYHCLSKQFEKIVKGNR